MRPFSDMFMPQNNGDCEACTTTEHEQFVYMQSTMYSVTTTYQRMLWTICKTLYALSVNATGKTSKGSRKINCVLCLVNSIRGRANVVRANASVDLLVSTVSKKATVEIEALQEAELQSDIFYVNGFIRRDDVHFTVQK